MNLLCDDRSRWESGYTWMGEGIPAASMETGRRICNVNFQLRVKNETLGASGPGLASVWPTWPTSTWHRSLSYSLQRSRALQLRDISDRNLGQWVVIWFQICNKTPAFGSPTLTDSRLQNRSVTIEAAVRSVLIQIRSKKDKKKEKKKIGRCIPPFDLFHEWNVPRIQVYLNPYARIYSVIWRNNVKSTIVDYEYNRVPITWISKTRTSTCKINAALFLLNNLSFKDEIV